MEAIYLDQQKLLTPKDDYMYVMHLCLEVYTDTTYLANKAELDLHFVILTGIAAAEFLNSGL